jgi:hypothetical protein
MKNRKGRMRSSGGSGWTCWRAVKMGRRWMVGLVAGVGWGWVANGAVLHPVAEFVAESFSGVPYRLNTGFLRVCQSPGFRVFSSARFDLSDGSIPLRLSGAEIDSAQLIVPVEGATTGSVLKVARVVRPIEQMTLRAGFFQDGTLEGGRGPVRDGGVRKDSTVVFDVTDWVRQWVDGTGGESAVAFFAEKMSTEVWLGSSRGSAKRWVQLNVEYRRTQAGPAGPPGTPGLAGPAGVAGPPGARGEKGEKGDRGETGSAGLPGLTGARGERGERGEKGERGDVGVGGASWDSVQISPRGDIPMGPFQQRGP